MKETINAADTPVEQGLTVSQTAQLGMNRVETPTLQSVDLTQPLPDLATSDAIPLDLTSDYWTPERIGEEKRVFFVKIGTSLVKPVDGEDLVQLECAYFLEKVGEEVRQIRNGSRRLVGALTEALDQGFIRTGTPMLLTYMGKRRNRTNSFSSDTFSIKPLRIAV